MKIDKVEKVARRYMLYFLLTSVLSQCLGPALSQHYACEHEKELPLSSITTCGFVGFVKATSQAEKDNYLLLCAISLQYYKNYCNGQSSVMPWWVSGYRHQKNTNIE